mgnify:CR=1 FL=1
MVYADDMVVDVLAYRASAIDPPRYPEASRRVGRGDTTIDLEARWDVVHVASGQQLGRL